MIRKEDLERDSKTYDNKNAKTNCPDCDSLNTYYHKNTLYCQDCKAEYFIKMLDKKTLAKLLKTASLLAITGLLFYFIF